MTAFRLYFNFNMRPYTKATKSRLDNMYLHVPVFLGAGWSVVTVWPNVSQALSPWALHLCVIGGEAQRPVHTTHAHLYPDVEVTKVLRVCVSYRA